MSKRVSRTSLNSTSSSKAEFVLKRGSVARSALMLGTALGCSIAVFTLGAPGQAWAVNECGPVATSGGVDTATCMRAGNPYPSGITYSDGSGNGLVVVLDPLTSVNANGNGVFANNTGGAYTGVILDSNTSVIGCPDGVGGRQHLRRRRLRRELRQCDRQVRGPLRLRHRRGQRLDPQRGLRDVPKARLRRRGHRRQVTAGRQHRHPHLRHSELM